MRKLLPYILILLCVSWVTADDYWVYIRKETKITDYNNPEQVAGMSDTGDIVEVVPCTPQFIPTKREKEIYEIIKIKDLKELDKLQLKDTIRETVTIPAPVKGNPDVTFTRIIKFRRYGVNIAGLSNEKEFTKNEVAEKINDKIGDKPIVFYATSK